MARIDVEPAGFSYYVLKQFFVGCAAEFQTTASQVERNDNLHYDKWMQSTLFEMKDWSLRGLNELCLGDKRWWRRWDESVEDVQIQYTDLRAYSMEATICSYFYRPTLDSCCYCLQYYNGHTCYLLNEYILTNFHWNICILMFVCNWLIQMNIFNIIWTVITSISMFAVFLLFLLTEWWVTIESTDYFFTTVSRKRHCARLLSL